jgi:hypothetical protein
LLTVLVVRCAVEDLLPLLGRSEQVSRTSSQRCWELNGVYDAGRTLSSPSACLVASVDRPALGSRVHEHAVLAIVSGDVFAVLRTLKLREFA